MFLRTCELAEVLSPQITIKMGPQTANPKSVTVQGDPDLETFQSLYFHFRGSTLSDLAPSLAICLYVYC
jgi:hypothetical protein